MSNQQQLEFWQSGPVPGIEPILQPVIHALLQAEREIKNALSSYPTHLLWTRPAGVASVGFHLQHIPGVLDRLFTYARGEMLSAEQLLFLNNEALETNGITTIELVGRLSTQLQIGIVQLRSTTAAEILEPRFIGRKQIPSNVLGLLFHAAEHTQRHTGQLLVTARVALSQQT